MHRRRTGERTGFGQSLIERTACAAFLKHHGLSYTRRAARTQVTAEIAMTLATHAGRMHEDCVCTRASAVGHGVAGLLPREVRA